MEPNPPPPSSCPVCGLDLVPGITACPRCGGDPSRTWVGFSSAPPDAGAAAAAGAARSPPVDLDPDQRYQVIEALGRGSTGIVYKVRDRELDEIIVLKVLDPLYDKSAEVVDRFKRELKMARRINHPNVARLFDLVSWHGRLAISQELVDGESLEKVLARGPLPIDEVLHHLRYLASALDAAHNIGVVHRDLKPANIMIDAEGRPRILDFGLAVAPGQVEDATRGHVVGTPGYIAPEQVLHPGHVDHRSDLYSLGVILFRMVTGALPYPVPRTHEARLAQAGMSPPRPRELAPELPPAFDEVLLRALARDPERRYPTARALEDDLAARLARRRGPPVALPPGSRGRVLLVDDDAAARGMLTHLLAVLGVAAIGAGDGAEGFDLAVAERPGLIFLDLNMPVCDGKEALRRLKADPRTAAVPVVMLTGSADPDDALFSRELGAAVFVNKPIALDVLELVIERYLPRAARA
jgi:CheY-like chemotaxis protein